MSREQIGFVVAVTILITLIIGAIITEGYGVQGDQRPPPAPFGTAKPTRPPHPIDIYYPPGEPYPTVPGDPGWRKS